MVGQHFLPFSAPSLPAYVQRLRDNGFRCFGLPSNVTAGLPPVQQQRFAKLLLDAGLHGWLCDPGIHAFDDPQFRQARLWTAALGYHGDLVQHAAASGLRGAIIGTPPDAMASAAEAEQHLGQLAALHPGRVWIANTDQPGKRTGTAHELADLCRATGALPCYNAPAHAIRVGRRVSVDEHKEALRELGPHAVVLYGNHLVRGGLRVWEFYEAEFDRAMTVPLADLVAAMRELGRLGTPVLVHGAGREYDARKALAKARSCLPVVASA